MPEEQAQANPLSMEERWKAFADLDPEAYVKLRGPIDQNSNSVWEGQSNRYEELTAAANAAGFESVEAAIEAATKAKVDDKADQSPHPAHALLDEIHSNLQVQYNPTWLRKKLDELRKAL